MSTITQTFYLGIDKRYSNIVASRIKNVNILDVEIMWALKQSPNHYLLSTEITKINPQIIFNETTKERLGYLIEHRYVDTQTIQETETGYLLTADGIDFMWGGKLKQRIMNVLSTGDYSITHLSRLLSKSRDDIKREINRMQEETPPIVTRYDKERKRYIKLIPSGEKYIQQNNKSDSSTNMTHHAEQVNTSSVIDIQNITSKIDKLLMEINNETNLSPVEKEFLTKSVRDTSVKFAQLREDLTVFAEKFTGNMLKSFLGMSSSGK